MSVEVDENNVSKEGKNKGTSEMKHEQMESKGDVGKVKDNERLSMILMSKMLGSGGMVMPKRRIRE